MLKLKNSIYKSNIYSFLQRLPDHLPALYPRVPDEEDPHPASAQREADLHRADQDGHPRPRLPRLLSRELRQV